jgi:flagellar motor switch/type III secretory pathway protein FliN
VTTECREWLPEGFISAGRLEAACAATLDLWQERWISAKIGQLTVKDCQADRPGRAVWTSLYDTAALTLALNEPARDALWNALVGPVPEQAELTLPDRSVLEGLAKAAIEDLGKHLSRLGGADGTVAGSVRAFDVSAAGKPLLRLQAKEDWVARVLRSGIVPTQASKRPLEPLTSALALCRVAVDVELGSAQVEMAELGGLAVGDVIVLDATVGAPLDLRLAHSAARVAGGTLTEVSGHNAIVIAS